MWSKIDDAFPHHPKTVAAGLEGRDLFIAGLCYCGRYLTDGRIPATVVTTLSPLVTDPRKTTEKLVEVGLWERDGEDYRVHDYLVYNPSAEQVKADRAAAAERKRLERERKKQRHAVTADVTSAVSHAVTEPEGEANRACHAVSHTSPVLVLVPSLSEEKKNPPTPLAGGSVTSLVERQERQGPPGFERWWDLNPYQRGKLRALKVWREMELEDRADEVIAGLRRDASLLTRKEPRPMNPSTWLRRGSWMDDPRHTSQEAKDRAAARAEANRLEEETRRQREAEARALEIRELEVSKTLTADQRAFAVKYPVVVRNYTALIEAWSRHAVTHEELEDLLAIVKRYYVTLMGKLTPAHEFLDKWALNGRNQILEPKAGLL